MPSLASLTKAAIKTIISSMDRVVICTKDQIKALCQY